MPESRPLISIVNVVATASIDQKLDLKDVSFVKALRYFCNNELSIPALKNRNSNSNLFNLFISANSSSILLVMILLQIHDT